MGNIFFASDHHLAHKNIVQFEHNGSKLRDFVTCEEHDEYVIQQHNSIVTAQDKIYFLGDVAINKRGLHLIKRFNGKKRLILGNHDIFDSSKYLEAGFANLFAYRVFDDFICSHIPIHEESLKSRWKVNVHGHLHAHKVMKGRGVVAKTGETLYSNQANPRYVNVSLEQLPNYLPLSIEEIRSKFP